jgi:hypothetical protein
LVHQLPLVGQPLAKPRAAVGASCILLLLSQVGQVHLGVLEVGRVLKVSVLVVLTELIMWVHLVRPELRLPRGLALLVEIPTIRLWVIGLILGDLLMRPPVSPSKAHLVKSWRHRPDLWVLVPVMVWLDVFSSLHPLIPPLRLVDPLECL